MASTTGPDWLARAASGPPAAGPNDGAAAAPQEPPSHLHTPLMGVGYAPKGTMRARVLVPCHDRAGVLRAYCGIATNPETSPRFLFPDNFRPEMHIWNAHRVIDGDDLYVCRDVVEALGAMQNGIENAVAFLAPITAHMLEMLAALCDEKKVETIQLF